MKITWYAATALGVALGLASCLSASAQQATPAPTCAQPNATAHVINAVAPDVAAAPASAVSVVVQVDLTETSSIASARVARSSGLPLYDKAALAAANASTFQTAIANCKPLRASYEFILEFAPNPSSQIAHTPSVPWPTFAPPVGWTILPSEGNGFYNLTKGASTIFVSGGPRANRTLDQLVQNATERAKALGYVTLASAALRICHGTQDGWRIEDSSQVIHRIRIFAVTQDALYITFYLHPQNEPADHAALDALDSLCLPPP